MENKNANLFTNVLNKIKSKFVRSKVDIPSEDKDKVLLVNGLKVNYGPIQAVKGINLKISEGQIVALLGANGAGKSTFLKILSSQVEHTSGDIIIESGKRIGVLGQDQFAFENFTLKDAVLWGNKRLYDAIKEKEKLYLSEEFTDEINERLSELEIISAEEDPTYEYETRIEKILSSLGLHEYDKLMSEIESSDKVKILLSSKTVFKFSIQIESIGPSQTIQLFCLLYEDDDSLHFFQIIVNTPKIYVSSIF
jgi:ABC-type multidrug transport system fused ATPase/permease subunit